MMNVLGYVNYTLTNEQIEEQIGVSPASLYHSLRIGDSFGGLVIAGFEWTRLGIKYWGTTC